MIVVERAGMRKCASDWIIVPYGGRAIGCLARWLPTSESVLYEYSSLQLPRVSLRHTLLWYTGTTFEDPMWIACTSFSRFRYDVTYPNCQVICPMLPATIYSSVVLQFRSELASTLQSMTAKKGHTARIEYVVSTMTGEPTGRTVTRPWSHQRQGFICAMNAEDAAFFQTCGGHDAVG